MINSVVLNYWADGNWYYHIKDQWCEPNVESELAHAMLTDTLLRHCVPPPLTKGRTSLLTLEDYQGNVRAVIDQLGTLQEVNNYYPYGGLMGGGTVGNNQSVQPYKYCTKELDRQNGLDWYDSQARMYDPLLGSTTTMDALAEKYYSISPYTWCAGNPILFVDPTGEYTMENINDCNAYNVIAVFQSGIELMPEEKRFAIQMSLDNARIANVPILYVDDIKDFARAMADLKQINVSTDTYMITSHGSEQSFYIGADAISWSTDLSDLKSGLEGKNVVINACNVAKNDSRGCGSSFVESLSADIGGTVFASPQAIKGWSAFRFTPLVTRGDNGQFSNVFYKSSNGSQATIVKNLVVNKMYKISHDKYALPIY